MLNEPNSKLLPANAELNALYEKAKKTDSQNVCPIPLLQPIP